MLRLSLFLLEAPQLGRGNVYYIDAKPGPIANWRHSFRHRSTFHKVRALVCYGVMGVLSYVALCVVAHAAHEPAIQAAFHQTRAEIMTGATTASSSPSAQAGGEKIDYYTIVPVGEESKKHSSGASALKGVRAPLKRIFQKDYTLSTWEEVEATLQEGDIILMMGEGPLSWAIATIQYAYAFMRPPALFYSHVSVVVKPPVYHYTDENGKKEAGDEVRSASGPPADSLSPVTVAASVSSARTPRSGRWWRRPFGRSRAAELAAVEELLKAESRQIHRARVKERGAIVLEGMDNTEYDVADIHGNVVHFAVQQVEAEKRLTSTRRTYWSGKEVQGYRHCAVRRLSAAERSSPAFQERLTAYIARNEGRPVEQNLFYPLAFFSPRFYLRVNPLREQRNVVSCGEMVAELYEELGLFERHWRWVRLTDGNGKAVDAEADIKRGVWERCRIAFSTFIGPWADTSEESLAASEVARQQAQQQGLPPPTPGDLRPTNATAVPQLHVYERLHSRKELASELPLAVRGRPTTAPFACIENWGVLASAMLKQRSVEGCEKLDPADQRAILDHANDRALREMEEAAMTASFAFADRPRISTVATTSSATRATREPLRAGMIVPTSEGGTAQLQYYHRRNTMQTMPYTWTQGESERVLDWAKDYSQPNYVFTRVDSNEEGQWRLRRAARMANARGRNGADGNTTNASATETPLPAADDVMLLDLRMIAAEEAREKGVEVKATPRGPQLGPEIRMQPPNSIRFESSNDGEEVVRA